MTDFQFFVLFIIRTVLTKSIVAKFVQICTYNSVFYKTFQIKNLSNMSYQAVCWLS
jgi:hypothetical protein